MYVCHFVSLEERNSPALVHNITFFEDVIDIRMSGSRQAAQTDSLGSPELGRRRIAEHK